MVNPFRMTFTRLTHESVLNWLGFSDSEDQVNFYGGQNDLSTDISVDTLRLVIEKTWDKLQSGLTLGEIENIIFFILFVRFVLLAIKYNLKTSFYIVCISFASGYLWYRHLIDLLVVYRNMLVELPFFYKLGLDGIEIREISRQSVKYDVMLGDNVHWYNVWRLLYYSFTKGIVHVDPVSTLKTYIDPISMIVSNLDEPLKSKVVPYYYKVYGKIIPKLFRMWSRYWSGLSGLVTYVFIVRIGKKNCPYLIRWHWTFILVFALGEQILQHLVNRMIYFQINIIFPKVMDEIDLYDYVDDELLFEMNFLTVLLCTIAVVHISFILICLLHAICGQYFYVPFITENTELHIGPRPINSIYSGGYTSWQDEKEKKRKLEQKFRIPTFWYGWLGKRRNSNWQPIQFIVNSIERTIRLWIKKFRKK